MSHTEKQAKLAIVQKLYRVKTVDVFYNVHCATIDIQVNERDREDKRAPWVSKDRVWCLLFLPPCRFACLWQKWKASSYVCTVCAFQVLLYCLCTACVCLSAIKQCGRLCRSQCLCIVQSDSVDTLHACLRFGCFPQFWLFLSLLPSFDIHS